MCPTRRACQILIFTTLHGHNRRPKSIKLFFDGTETGHATPHACVPVCFHAITSSDSPLIAMFEYLLYVGFSLNDLEWLEHLPKCDLFCAYDDITLVTLSVTRHDMATKGSISPLTTLKHSTPLSIQYCHGHRLKLASNSYSRTPCLS